MIKRPINTYNKEELTNLLKEPLMAEEDQSHGAPEKSAITLLDKFADKVWWLPVDQYDDDDPVKSLSTEEAEQTKVNTGKNILLKVVSIDSSEDSDGRIEENVYSEDLENIADEVNKRTNDLIMKITEKKRITKDYNLTLYYKYIVLLFFQVPIINILEYFFIERMGPIDEINENKLIFFNNIVTFLFVLDILIRIIDLNFINLEDLKLTVLEILPAIGGLLIRVVALKTHVLPRCAFLRPFALCVALFFYGE